MVAGLSYDLAGRNKGQEPKLQTTSQLQSHLSLCNHHGFVSRIRCYRISSFVPHSCGTVHQADGRPCLPNRTSGNNSESWSRNERALQCGSIGDPSVLLWRSVGAPLVLRRRSVGFPSAFRHRFVGASLALRRRFVGAPSALRRSVGAPSALRRRSIGAP